MLFSVRNAMKIGFHVLVSHLLISQAQEIVISHMWVEKVFAFIWAVE